MRFGFLVAIPLLAGCAPEPTPEIIRHFPLDSLDELSSRVQVVLDATHSVDGRGAVRVDAPGPVVVPLVETSVDLEDALLIAQVAVRTAALDGEVYLEMLCRFPGRGEFFSRGLDAAVGATQPWTRMQTVFYLREGENPDRVRLNLVFTGSGTAWVDNARLLRRAHG